MKNLKSSIGIAVLVSLSSCQKSFDQKTPEDEVVDLTTQFFQFVQDDKEDSINIIYPSLDLLLLPLHSDSISIKGVKTTPEGKLEVELVNNYSEFNTDETNIKTNITLLYEKQDSTAYGYIISDSKGIYKRDGVVPFDAERSGCIDSSKKYSDMDYIRRLKIAEEIQDIRAREIADLLNSNVKVLVNNNGAVYNDVARFVLDNPTDYSCQGFTVHLELSNWTDGQFQGQFDGFYNYEEATLLAHSRHNYSMSIERSKLKNPDRRFVDIISGARFETTTKFVKENTYLKYSGKEYDEYINTHKK